jgi:hypothetical protein
MSPVIEIALHLEPGGDGQNLAQQIEACQAEVLEEQRIQKSAGRVRGDNCA